MSSTNILEISKGKVFKVALLTAVQSSCTYMCNFTCIFYTYYIIYQ